jgi:hypothetical protein
MHYLENWIRQADPQIAAIAIDLGTALSLSGLIVEILKSFVG